MNKRFLASTAAAAFGLGFAASVCFAGPIEDRQQLMKDNGAAIKALAQMAQGETPFDAAAAKKHAETLVNDFEKLKDLFPEGSDKGPPETWAKPEIWSDREGFEKVRLEAVEASKAATAVTEAGQLGGAVGAIGETCKSCHEKYRLPKS